MEETCTKTSAKKARRRNNAIPTSSNNSLKSHTSGSNVSDMNTTFPESSSSALFDKYDKEPYVIFTKKSGDRKSTKLISALKVAWLLHKYNIKFASLENYTWNTWKVIFTSFHEANSSLHNNFVKETGLSLYIPRFKLFRKGVIKDIPLDITLKELKTSLINKNKNFRVNNIFRLKRKDKTSGKWIDSQSVCIEFRGQELPFSVKLWRVNLKINPYIPLIRRCFRCGKLGHTSKGCDKTEGICFNCGSSHPFSKENPYQLSAKCVNCKEEHHSLSNKYQKIGRAHV